MVELSFQQTHTHNTHNTSLRFTHNKQRSAVTHTYCSIYCTINKIHWSKNRRPFLFQLHLSLQGQIHLDTSDDRQYSLSRPCSYVPFNEVKQCAVLSDGNQHVARNLCPRLDRDHFSAAWSVFSSNFIWVVSVWHAANACLTRVLIAFRCTEHLSRQSTTHNSRLTCPQLRLLSYTYPSLVIQAHSLFMNSLDY